MGQSDDKVAAVATVLYLLFLPLYPIRASLMGEGTSNVVIAAATVVNVLVTAVYAVHMDRVPPSGVRFSETLDHARSHRGDLLRRRPYTPGGLY